MDSYSPLFLTTGGYSSCMKIHHSRVEYLQGRGCAKAIYVVGYLSPESEGAPDE